METAGERIEGGGFSGKFSATGVWTRGVRGSGAEGGSGVEGEGGRGEGEG